MSSILEPDRIDQNDESALSAVVAAAAAGGCSRSAQWLLAHHPQHRERWGNKEQLRAAVESALVIVARGISRSGLAPHEQQRVLLSIRAEGVGLDETEEPDA